MFEFITIRIPSMFSQIQVRGSEEIHEIISSIQTFVKTTRMMRRVHANDQNFVDVCRALRRFFNECAETINVHAKLPGLGRQVRALLKTEAARFLVGREKAEMAGEILSGSAESCKFPYQASGFSLATWKARKAERQSHSRAPKRPFQEKQAGSGPSQKKRPEFKN